ncbi:MAG TPA: hypothetical protein VN039_13930 [Nitrospira sp.]|nr:hypothetical protein [Nitrospira sp.]
MAHPYFVAKHIGRNSPTSGQSPQSDSWAVNHIPPSIILAVSLYHITHPTPLRQYLPKGTGLSGST